MTGWLCSGWDSSLLKYDGEVFLKNCLLHGFLLEVVEKFLLKDEISSVWSLLTCCRIGYFQSEVVCNHMCLCINVLI